MPSLYNKGIDAFFELLRAGLWEKEAFLSSYSDIDYAAIMRLADEQSVVGLITSGMEQVKDVRIPQVWTLQFVGSTLQVEKKNEAMNQFIAILIRRFKAEKITTVLVKGQGVAQAYERPLWRASGDVDLLLNQDDYKKAKLFLPRYGVIESEDISRMHLAMNIDSWIVELHGHMPFAMSKKADKVLDDVIEDTLTEGSVRVWNNGESEVPLPNPDNDLVIIFTHFLHHFFLEGVGLRQICDWCRLLWKYNSVIDRGLLQDRIQKAGLMTEWKCFGIIAVEVLGLPKEMMPFYDPNFKHKSQKVLRRILQCGNMGQNNDVNYRRSHKKIIVALITLWRRLKDFASLITVFPVDSPKFFFTYSFNRIRVEALR